jgi:CRP/FNR family cyclic AMP-dependent transcriptional regulator
MTPHPHLLKALSGNPWFNALPMEVREVMVNESEPMHLRRGEMLFRQGDAASGLYALVRGSLKISTLREDGKEAILVVMEAGTWFGEVSLIDNQPRTHDATSLGQSEVLMLPRPVFDALMTRPVFTQAITAMLAARVRLLYGIVEDATLRSTRARIVRRLLLLARGDATMAPGMRLRVPVSQEALAMMLGITRQTLSTELKLLAEQGAVRMGYRYIEVLSEERLRGMTDAT